MDTRAKRAKRASVKGGKYPGGGGSIAFDEQAESRQFLRNVSHFSTCIRGEEKAQKHTFRALERLSLVDNRSSQHV